MKELFNALRGVGGFALMIFGVWNDSVPCCIFGSALYLASEIDSVEIEVVKQ